MFGIGKVCLYIGNSQEEFNRIRDTLDAHQIKYRHRIISHEDAILGWGRGSVRMESGTRILNDRAGKLYEITVSAKNAETAQHYIRQ